MEPSTLSASGSARRPRVAGGKRPRGWAWRALTACEWALLGGVALGAGLAGGVRDLASPLPALLFYGAPLPLLCLAAACGAALARKRGRRRRSWAWAALSLALLLGTLNSEWFPARSRPPLRDSLRVATWNIQGGRAGRVRLEQAILELDADLICLGEVGVRTNPADALAHDLEVFLRTHGYVTRAWPAERLLIGLRATHGRLLRASQQRPGGVCRLLLVDARWRERPLRVALADFYSSPLIDRRPGTSALAALLAEGPGPWICLGDFNTPRTSTCFDPWRAAGARHAFEEAGAGYAPTWPTPWPVLSIDHIWTQGLSCASAQAPVRPESDHCPLVAELGWE